MDRVGFLAHLIRYHGEALDAAASNLSLQAQQEEKDSRFLSCLEDVVVLKVYELLFSDTALLKVFHDTINKRRNITSEQRDMRNEFNRRYNAVRTRYLVHRQAIADYRNSIAGHCLSDDQIVFQAWNGLVDVPMDELVDDVLRLCMFSIKDCGRYFGFHFHANSPEEAEQTLRNCGTFVKE